MDRISIAIRFSIGMTDIAAENVGIKVPIMGKLVSSTKI